MGRPERHCSPGRHHVQRISIVSGCQRHIYGCKLDDHERERAALRWAEILNGQPHTDASDEEFALVRKQFSDTEIVELGYAVATIRAWNTLNLSLRNPVPEVPAPGF